MPDFAAEVMIIGGGIAGVTAAYELSKTHEVILLEQEAELAYHTTSRSAALYIENEGGPVQHRLSTASRSFLEDPPDDIDAPLLSPRGCLNIGTPETADQLRSDAAAAAKVTPSIRFVDQAEALDLCPVLRPERVSCGMFEPLAMTVDVMALHQLFLRGARQRSAQVKRSARVTALKRTNDTWQATTAAGSVEAAVVVNAAGAWGDVVGEMAGAAPIGLTPCRRTAFTTTIDQNPEAWPFIYNPRVEATCYFQPESGNQLMASLADQTPTVPGDARPEEIDVALAINNINELTTLDVRSVNTTWAGLRTFAPDRHPVFGWDDAVEGFCWAVGQGGCGIVTSRAAGEVVGSVVRNEPLPSSIADLGLTLVDMAPRRSEPSRFGIAH